MKQAKESQPLTKAQYLKQFSRSARWRLGAAEAEEAIADYRELVEQEERDESKLVEELGDPVQAAWLLTEAREFKRWRWVFGILVCCALFVANWAYDGLPIYWRIRPYFPELWMEFAQMIFPLAVGLILSLSWFRRERRTSRPAPKLLLTALVAVALAGAVMLFQVWRCFNVKWDITWMDGLGFYTPEYASAMEWTIYAGALISLMGAVGVLLARCCDRRWAALFVLCLTVGVLCLMCQYILLALDPQAGTVGAHAVRAQLFHWLAPVGIVGLVGTGVSLC